MILFIDDEKNILSAMQRLFLDESYELLFANNALEGIKMLSRTKADVIICDIKMPVMSGIEFFSIVKKNHPESVRIIVSAVHEKDIVTRAINEGEIWKYILKPWDDTMMLDLVREAVKLSRGPKRKDEHNFNFEKKIFFLYPHEIIHEELIIDLIFNGYECYELHDEKTALKILGKYRESLLFINIDKQLKDLDWEKYITKLLNSEQTQSVLVGILSYNTDPNLRKLYLMKLGVQCGFIQLKASYQKISDTFLKVFEANEAKGRRQAVRAIVEKQEDALFNIKYGNAVYYGKIIDISKAAMACTMEEHPRLEIDDQIGNIQLKLKGVPVQTSGIIKMKRIQNGEFMFIIGFTCQKPEIGKKICHFVYRTLSEKVGEESANL
ncbi:MAG: response regulator [Spirochaetales bacterium]|nr:response regulator [Spirochaetales bacterium]